MLVTFNPMISPGTSIDAAYMNFLRCVRAICTAASGTSSLTVNPFTTNTGTIDNTRNCIVSIDANAEAGGWTESTASNVIQSGSFTAIISAATNLYKFDAYNASNKGTYPFMKLSFHAPPRTSYSASYYATGAMRGGVVSEFATYPFIRMTFGCHTATDWSGSGNYPPTTDGYPNYNQATSWTMNDIGSNTSNTPSTGMPSFWANNSQVNYRMAVTATYCIIWEVHTSNSYANGYSNLFTGNIPSFYNSSACYGGLMYGGLRETVLWENSRSDNPPWVAMQIYHVQSSSVGQSAANPQPANSVCAFMATLDSNGIPSTTAQRFWVNNVWNGAENTFNRINDERTSPTGAPSGFTPTVGTTGASASIGLVNGPFIYQDGYAGGPGTSSLYMPTVDAATGTGVPSAYPIVVRRNSNAHWNPGGAIRGMYKSLGMTQSLMKNYFSAGQTYSIYNPVLAVTDTYIPVVFNQTMYLIRYA